MIALFRPFERRSNLANPEQWMVDAFGGQPSKSGIRVSADTALASSAVYACVQVRAQTLASLPLKLFERQPNGDKVPAVGHPLYALLADSPHPDLTNYEFFEMMEGHIALRGNAYAQIVRDNSGAIRRLVPLHPDRVIVRRSRLVTPDGLRPLIYDVTNVGFGGTVPLEASQILHLRNFGGDGVVGYSPIRIASETIGLALAADEHAARTFANGAKPAGVLEHPAKLGDVGAKNLRTSWQEVHGGVSNTGKVAILEEGMKFHELGLTNEDAQLLQSRKYSRTEIASIFRVPPHLIGDLERATFSNIEQQAIEFVQNCMRPICVRTEKRLKLTLLSAEEQANYFFSFNLAGLLRGDLPSRYAAYAVGRTGGWLSVNDIRETEDMNRVKGGDSYLTPLNMTAQTARASLAPLLADALGRVFRKEAKAVRAVLKNPEASRAVETFYAEHRRYFLELLAPVCAAARNLGADFPVAESIADQLIAESRSELLPALADPARVELFLTSWETTRSTVTTSKLLA